MAPDQTDLDERSDERGEEQGNLNRLAILNQLRSEHLDERAAFLNRWLTVVGLVLTFFGIVVTIAAYIGFSKFSELSEEIDSLLAEARDSVRQIERHSEEAEDLVEKIEERNKGASNGEVISTDGPESADLYDADPESLLFLQMGLEEFITQTGSLSEDGKAEVRLRLDGGTHFFIADCDANCDDLDLEIYDNDDSEGDESSQPLDSDYLADANPIVSYEAVSPLDARIEILMYECLASSCKWELRGYKQLEDN